MNAIVGERLYGNPNSHILQTRGVSRPPRRGVSISSLSEGSGYYTGVRDFRGGPVSTGGPEPRLFGLTACLFRDTRRSWTFLSRETGPGPLPGEQDSGPQGSGCLDVVNNN